VREIGRLTDGADDGRLADRIGLDVDREVGDPLEVVLDGIVIVIHGGNVTWLNVKVMCGLRLRQRVRMGESGE